MNYEKPKNFYNLSEDELKKIIFDILGKNFFIMKEVTGYFLNKKVRIDAIIKPKKQNEWANKNIEFGIEFKSPKLFAENIQLNKITKSIAQCVDYTYTKFDGHNYLRIFLCPSLLPLNTENIYFKHFLAQLGVGELSFYSKYHGLALILNGNDIIWSQYHGVKKGKYQKFLKRIGSR